MNNKKTKEFIDELKLLCLRYNLALDLSKIKKEIKATNNTKKLDIEKETGRSFWGNLAGLVKKSKN